MHIKRYQNWGRNDLGEKRLGGGRVLWSKRLGYGGAKRLWVTIEAKRLGGRAGNDLWAKRLVTQAGTVN